jgi:hypothetical protein
VHVAVDCHVCFVIGIVEVVVVNPAKKFGRVFSYIFSWACAQLSEPIADTYGRCGQAKTLEGTLIG